MRKYLLIFITLLLHLSLNAQELLYKGKVIDAKYQTPVPYAAVYIHNTNHGTVANNVGEFSFLAPDSLQNVHLVIAKEKYKLYYLSVKDQEEDFILIQLLPDDFELRSKNIQDSLAGSSSGFASFLTKAVDFVKDDWIALGDPESNKFDFGRIQTFPTYNPIEGVRLRAGFASNSRMNPNFFIKGYAAYGFGDQKLKYRGEAVYTFDRKAYHDDEFPKNNVSIIYENDLYSPGEMYSRSPNNLLLLTFLRSKNEATYRNFAELNWEREDINGFAQSVWLRRSRMVPQGELAFQYHKDNQILVDEALYTSEVGVQFRYSAREAYIQQKRKRRPIEMTSPVFFLSHSVGLADVFDNELPYHRTEISAQKRFLLSNAGHVDVVGEMMKVWNTVPFPLLVYPNQRHRHHIESNAFFLSRALEFVADEQVTLRATFVGDDLLFSKIPVLNVLQFRELFSFRASYGRLSDKNIPGLRSLSNNESDQAELYNFPYVSNQYGSVPYIEGTVGITNILGLLRVEYVHRFTYRDHPDALLGKVRVDVTL